MRSLVRKILLRQTMELVLLRLFRGPSWFFVSWTIFAKGGEVDGSFLRPVIGVKAAGFHVLDDGTPKNRLLFALPLCFGSLQEEGMLGRVVGERFSDGWGWNAVEVTERLFRALTVLHGMTNVRHGGTEYRFVAHRDVTPAQLLVEQVDDGKLETKVRSDAIHHRNRIF